MRSLIASLRTLVLPAGAITGPRIVLDGINGVIEVYDASNQRVLLVDDSGLTLTPDEAETIEIGHDSGGTHPLIGFHHEALADIEGRIDLIALGSYDVAMRIAAPVATGNDQAMVLMASEDSSAGLPPTFRVRDNGPPEDLLQVDGGATSRTTIRTDELQVSSAIAQTHSGTTDAVGTITFNHGASIVPKIVIAIHEAPMPGPTLDAVDTYTATTARVRYSVGSAAVTWRTLTIV